MGSTTRNKICIVVSSELTAKAFLLDQLRATSRIFDVTVVANTCDTNFLNREGIEATVVPIPIQRKISVLSDLQCLYQLVRLFVRQRYHLISSVTPKAGLLAMSAGALTGIPVRIHTFTGQVWVRKTGLFRWLLKWMDNILSILSTVILVDSPSQREFLIQQRIVSANKSAVLANGSISGVDTGRFRPDQTVRKAMRLELGIRDNHFVFLFVGRMNRDKGVLDLAHAFAQLADEFATAHLVLIGPDEEKIVPKVREICLKCTSRLHYYAYTSTPEQYMAASDVFCLPSYREGFGSVIIEAAASGIPAVGSRIYGITDAIEDGVTGLLFSVGDVEALKNCMKKLRDDTSLRTEMGEAARQRAIRDFSQEKLTAMVLEFYRMLMKKNAAIHAKTNL